MSSNDHAQIVFQVYIPSNHQIKYISFTKICFHTNPIGNSKVVILLYRVLSNDIQSILAGIHESNAFTIRMSPQLTNSVPLIKQLTLLTH